MVCFVYLKIGSIKEEGGEEKERERRGMASSSCMIISWLVFWNGDAEKEKERKKGLF